MSFSPSGSRFGSFNPDMCMMSYKLELLTCVSRLYVPNSTEHHIHVTPLLLLPKYTNTRIQLKYSVTLGLNAVFCGWINMLSRPDVTDHGKIPPLYKRYSQGCPVGFVAWPSNGFQTTTTLFPPRVSCIYCIYY